MQLYDLNQEFGIVVDLVKYSMFIKCDQSLC